MIIQSLKAIVMGVNPVNLRNAAWIMGLIFAVLGILLILSMFAFSAPPWTLENILMTFILGGVYVAGLLIGRKWPLAGGIMSLIVPIVAVSIVAVALLRGESGSGIKGYFGGLIIMFLVMMIPGFLYLLSRHFQRKSAQNGSSGEGDYTKHS